MRKFSSVGAAEGVLPYVIRTCFLSQLSICLETVLSTGKDSHNGAGN